MLKKFKNKFIVGIATLCLVVGFSAGVGANSLVESIRAQLDYRIKFLVDGEQWEPKDSAGKKLAPILYNGSTYLPVRAVSEALNVAVNWDGSTRTVVLGEQPDGRLLANLDFVRPNNNAFKTTDKGFTVQNGVDYKSGIVVNRVNSLNNLLVLRTGGQYQTGNFKLFVLENPEGINLTISNGDVVIKEVKLAPGETELTTDVNLGGVRELTLNIRGGLNANTRVFLTGTVK